MNDLFPRFLKSVYRKEPISGFILIMGAVDAVIGGVGERWTLLSFGLMLILLAAGLRWWQSKKTEAVSVEETPRRYLPPSSSQRPLPMLMNEQQRR